MYKRILLAVDGEGPAAPVIRPTAGLATSCGAEVLVFHVHDRRHDARTKREASALIEGMVAKLRAAGLAASGEVASVSDGGVAAAILDRAARLNADLIVMGSHGRSRLGAVLLGSVSQAVASGTDAAVALVRTDGGARSADSEPDRIHRILLTIDRSEHAEAAIEATKSLCGRHDATVAVLYVEPMFESPDAARSYVRNVADELLAEGIDARAEGLASVDSVPAQIAAAAARLDADIIVMGSSRRSPLSAVLVGSVTRELLRMTSRPVLLAQRAADC